MSRPCMSVSATTRVSIRPSRIDSVSSSRRWWLACPVAIVRQILRETGGPAGMPDRPACLLRVRRRPSGGSRLLQLPGCLLELTLDLRQLLLASHDSRALEPGSRPREVVDEQEDHGEDHEWPADIARGREREEDE